MTIEKKDKEEKPGEHGNDFPKKDEGSSNRQIDHNKSQTFKEEIAGDLNDLRRKENTHDKMTERNSSHKETFDKQCNDKNCNSKECAQKRCNEKTCNEKECSHNECKDMKAKEKECEHKECPDKSCNLKENNPMKSKQSTNSHKECNDKNCTDKECNQNQSKKSDNVFVGASQNYQSNGSNKKINEDKNKSDSRLQRKEDSNSVLFDSLVESEKNYIQKKLKCKVYDDYHETSNICVNFYRWIILQFEKLRYRDPSSTLISDLEYLQTQTDKVDLFIKEGSSDKTEKYRENIESANVENYENDIDVYALAAACRNEIKTSLVFFTKELEDKLLEVYRLNCTPEEKRFVIERTPFLMNYRSVFKLVKETLHSLDSKHTVDMNKSINLWADVICRFEAPKEKRVEILKDLMNVEFDHIPVNFYE